MVYFHSLSYENDYVKKFYLCLLGKEMLQMIADICKLHADGKFQAQPCTRHKLQDYKTATEAAMQSFTKSKQLFILAEDIDN